MSDTPTKQTARITPTDLRADADNIAHSNRGIYPVGPLLDAADELERLQVVIRSAREELEHGGGGETEAYLILKHSGVL